LNLINCIGNLIKQEADPYTQELPYYITDQIRSDIHVKSNINIQIVVARICRALT